MHKKTFEFENMTINVHYEKLPTKEDLEEACSVFYIRAMEDKKKKDDSSNSTQD